jgi:hypothetical protein
MMRKWLTGIALAMALFAFASAYEAQALGPTPPVDPSTPVTPVSVNEPSSLLLLAGAVGGVIGIGVLRRRMRRK